MNKERRWLSIKETAEKLGLHPISAYKMAGRGELPVAKLGRKILVDWKKLEEALSLQTERWGGRVK
jgi:excisionase family DNA binding protein